MRSNTLNWKVIVENVFPREGLQKLLLDIQDKQK